jgi:hypothetical protein
MRPKEGAIESLIHIYAQSGLPGKYQQEAPASAGSKQW